MSSGSLGKNSKTSGGHETKVCSKRTLKKGEETMYRFSKVNSTAQHFVDFTEAEEDLVFRMHRLVGNRWELIAGRIPGRTAEEVEKFWAKKHQEK